MTDFEKDREDEGVDAGGANSGSAGGGSAEGPKNSGAPEGVGDWLLLNFWRIPYFGDEDSPVFLDVAQQKTVDDDVLLVFDRAENRGAPEGSERAFAAVFSGASPGIEDMLARVYMKPKSFFCRPDAWVFVVDPQPSGERAETYRRAGAEAVSDVLEARTAVEELHRAGGPDAVAPAASGPQQTSAPSEPGESPVEPEESAEPPTREERREEREGPEGSGSGSARGLSGSPGSSLGRKSTPDRTRVALTSGPPKALSSEDIEALEDYRRAHEPEGRLQQMWLNTLKGLKIYNPPPRPQVGGRIKYRRIDVDGALAIRNSEWPAIACTLNNKGGTGKCLDTNTMLTDPVTGLRHTLGDYYKASGLSRVHTLEDFRGIKGIKITEKVDSGVQPTLRLRLKSGRSVKVTYHHPMLMADGWRKAEDIEVGETVAAAAREPFPEEPLEMSDAEIDLLSGLLAEGGTSQAGVTFTNADPSVVRRVSEAAKTLGMEIVPMSRSKPNEPRYSLRNAGDGPKPTKSNWGAVRKFTEEHLLRGKLAKDKRMPEAVFRLGPEQLGRFLAIFFMCDGYVDKREGAGTTLASKDLVEDIQHLLLRFGIQSKVGYKESGYTTADGERRTFDAWRLSVYSQHRRRFRDSIPLWGDKRERLDELCEKRNNPNSGSPTVTEELKGDIREAAFGTRKGVRGGAGHVPGGVKAKGTRRGRTDAYALKEAREKVSAVVSGVIPPETLPEAHSGAHGGAAAHSDGAAAATLEAPPPSTKDVRDKLGWSAFQFSFLFDRPTESKAYPTLSRKPFEAFIDTFGLREQYGWLAESMDPEGDSDVFWDEVVAVEDAGEQQVYDLSVEPTRNFVANDLIVHNTTCALNLAAALSRICRPKAWEGEGLQVLLVDQNFGNSDVRSLVRPRQTHPKGLTDYLMDLDRWQEDAELASENAREAAAASGDDPDEAASEVWAEAARKRPEVVRYVAEVEGLDNFGVLFVSGEGQEYEHEGMIDERQLEELHASISRYYDVVVVDLDKGLPQEGTPGALVMRFWAAAADVGFLVLDDSLPSFEQGGSFVDAARRILDQDTDDEEMRLPLVAVRNQVRETGFDATWDRGAGELGSDRLLNAEGGTEPYLRIPDDGQLPEFARERRFISLSSQKFKTAFQKMAVDFLKRAVSYRS